MMIFEPMPAFSGLSEGSTEEVAENTMAELCWQQLCLESGCPEQYDGRAAIAE
ncbi:hypothetical protein [Kushneria phosphatilytica]|uniref:hypothetical protein n=1 Tax=Kushneria phosphatilytica TaxID=657387 RepID=UPI00143944DF|nr:hypothetical protein [Kushneria phosphatilytica]